METYNKEVVVDTLTPEDIELLLEVLDNTSISLKDSVRYSELYSLHSKLIYILNLVDDL